MSLGSTQYLVTARGGTPENRGRASVQPVAVGADPTVTACGSPAVQR